MPSIFSFFRVPKHRIFEYKPLYASDKESRLTMSKGIKFREDAAQRRKQRKSVFFSQIRLIAIILFLLFATYYLFFM